MSQPAAPRRTDDGFAPIEDYAVIGDGRTVALIALDGRVDWWPLPTLDSPPVVSALIDPDEGGRLELAPAVPFTASRRYVGDSNVLETTFHTDGGTVRVVDALTVGAAGRLPWTEFARRVEGVSGSVPMRWTVRPGNRLGTAQPWVERREGSWLLHSGDQQLGIRCWDAGEAGTDGHGVGADFVATEGSRSLVAVVAADDEPVFLPHREAIEQRVDRTIASWHQWAEGLRYDGPWRDAVRRSALALKCLLYSPTGAIAAAATTSLPEQIGGPKNWDYRYAWIRDSAFTLDALLRLGLQEEVQGAVSWLLGTIRATAPDLHVFYKLDGRVAEEESTIPVRGYRDSRPVRSGNGASTQTQLGTFGDLLDTVHLYVRRGHVLDARTGTMLAGLADRCCDLWLRKDAGIWELDDDQHYTVSKVGCWVALDGATRLAETGQLPDRHAARWRATAADIREFVESRCWSPRKRSYTFYADSDDLDASVLLMARTGFDRGERLAATVESIRAELGRGPLLYRYTGMEKEEGAFLACSFWLVEAYALLGALDEARAVMDGVLEIAGDVGLLAEMADPASGGQLGNFPQGLTHLALVNAAATYAECAAARSR